MDVYEGTGVNRFSHRCGARTFVTSTQNLRKTVNRSKRKGSLMIDTIDLALSLLLNTIFAVPDKPDPAGGLPIPQHGGDLNVQ